MRFDPSAAPDARTYLFHPNQTMIDEVGWFADGLLPCGGAIANRPSPHDLGTDGAILAPESLKVLMWEEVEALHEHYRKMRRRSRAAKAAAG